MSLDVAQRAAAESTGVGVRRRAARRRTPGHGSRGISFVALYVVVLVLFGLLPLVFAVVNAFRVTPVVGPTRFNATENFTSVLSDYRTVTAAVNVLKYLVIWLPLLLVVVFVVALVMDAHATRFTRLTRFVSFVPGAITGAAAALLWLFMFSPTVSPIGPFLQEFVEPGQSFVNDSTLPWVLAVMGVAVGAGGWIVMLFGALTAIPSSVLEAARIDGAGGFKLAWHIKLPMLRSYAAFILIVSVAAGFQVFVEPQVLGAGVRGQVSTSWSLNQMVYLYASQGDYGRASALSLMLLVLTTALAVIIIRKTRFYHPDR